MHKSLLKPSYMARAIVDNPEAPLGRIIEELTFKDPTMFLAYYPCQATNLSIFIHLAPLTNKFLIKSTKANETAKIGLDLIGGVQFKYTVFDHSAEIQTVLRKVWNVVIVIFPGLYILELAEDIVGGHLVGMPHDFCKSLSKVLLLRIEVFGFWNHLFDGR